MERNMGEPDRVMSFTAGAALVGIAIRRRHAFGAASLTGAFLMARAITARCPVYAATGLSSLDSPYPRPSPEARARSITASITVNRRASEVFDYWRTVDHLPEFIDGLERLEEQQDHSMTAWSWEQPNGVQFDWIVRPAPPTGISEISWSSQMGADVRTMGTATFRNLTRGGCEVTVRMEYDQTGGAAGATLVWLVGRAPQGRLSEDLRRLKSLLETGEVAVAARPAGKRTLTYRALKAVTA